MPAGVLEVVGVVTDAVLGAGTAAEIGAGATSLLGATGASILGDAAVGSGLGALEAGITGADPGKGALFGGLTAGIAGGAEAAFADPALTAVDTAGVGTQAGPSLDAANLNLGPVQSPSLAAPASVGGASAGGAPAITASTMGLSPDLTAPAASADAISGFNANPALAVDPTAATGFGKITGTNLAPTDTIFGPGGSPVPVATSADPLAGLRTAPNSINLPDLADPSSLTKVSGGTAPTSVDKFASDPSFKNAFGIAKANPGATLSALGLGYQALSQPSLPNTSTITGDVRQTADRLAGQASILQSYITSGSLPPGLQQVVDNATQAAKAHARSLYPAGGTELESALANIDRQAAGQVAQIADQLLNTGISEAGMSADLYKTILGQTNAQNDAISKAIANFAASAAGGGRGITLNVGNG